MPASLLFAPTPSSPWALATADFDGDGKADLVVAGPDGRGVQLLLSGGRRVEVALDFTPVALAAGDVNGDGKPDLVVATSAYVAVFLSNGDGTFQDAVKYEAGDSPVAVAVGDLNGDGRGDLILLGARSHRVLVLLSNADGTMRAPISFAAGRIPTAVAVGDFNRDGRLDVVVADAGTNEVLLLLGNGDGTLQAAGSYAAGPLPRSLAVGDFNGDGIADVAVAGLGDGKVRLLLGTARGTLEPGVSYEAGMGWSSIVAADLEGRGKLDLVWANANTGTLSTLRGRGDGSFIERRELAMGVTGHIGVATATTATMLFTSPAGTATFGQQVTLTATVSSGAATGKVTFYDGTTILGVGTLAGGQTMLSTILLAAGHRSLMALYGGDGTYAPSLSAVVALNVNANPARTFAAASGSPFPSGEGSFPYSVVVADFNGDGKADLAVVNSGSGNVTVLLGNGSGGFTAASGSPFAAGTNPTSVAVGDFNGDGNADLAVVGGAVTVLLGNGSGGFTAASGSPFAAGSSPSSVAVGDFNGDGKADLAVANYGSNNVTVLLGNGSGSFTAASGSPFTAGSFPKSVVVGDFNGDGKADLAVANFYGNSVTVLLGNGSGSFTAASGSPFAAGELPISVAVGDFNGDGKADLAVANIQSDNVTVLLGNGNGGFALSGSPFMAGTSPASIAVGEFNGDGKADLAIANYGSNDVTVLLGTIASRTVGDFDGNGVPDLVWQNDSTRQVTVWYMGGAGGAVLQGWNYLSAAGNPGWHVAAVADFNGDGVPDLVWQNDSTRQATVWYMGGAGGAVLQGWNYLSAAGVPGWSIVAAADFNGDGVPDLVWQNDSTRQVTVWYMGGAGGAVFQNWNYLSAAGVPGWHVVAAVDQNGDGVPDLVWQNDSTRQVTVWYMGGAGGAVFQNWNYLSAAGVPGWHVVAAVDQNGDGVPDLVWQNDSTRQVTVWYMGGAGGAVFENWNYLSVAGVPGWSALN